MEYLFFREIMDQGRICGISQGVLFGSRVQGECRVENFKNVVEVSNNILNVINVIKYLLFNVYIIRYIFIIVIEVKRVV